MFNPFKTAALAAVSLLAVAGPALAVPLTTDLTSGNLQFHIDSATGCTAGAGGTNSSVPSCAGVEWVAVAGGFKLQATGGLGGNFESTSVAGPSNYADITLFFSVTSLNGSFITGTNLSADLTGRFSGITETIPTGNYADGSSTSTTAGIDGSSSTVTASKIFAGAGSSTVLLKADIKAASLNGTAGISGVTQTFATAVPEPASMALLLAGVAPLVLARRRRG